MVVEGGEEDWVGGIKPPTETSRRAPWPSTVHEVVGRHTVIAIYFS